MRLWSTQFQGAHFIIFSGNISFIWTKKYIPQKYYNIYTLFNSISIGTSQTTKNDENITQPYDSTFIADRFKYSIRREK